VDLGADRPGRRDQLLGGMYHLAAQRLVGVELFALTESGKISAAVTVWAAPLHSTSRKDLPMQPHSTQLPLPLETEEWRPVVGYDGIYEVSSLGRVRRQQPYHTASGLLRPYFGNTGYQRACLWREGRYSQRFIHQLVAEAFIGHRPDGYEVNHKDGNKLNNSPENLEWVTRSENVLHALAMGLRKPPRIHGEALPFAKLTTAAVRAIRLATPDVSAAELAQRFGVSRCTIYGVRAYRTWTHVGVIP